MIDLKLQAYPNADDPLFNFIQLPWIRYNETRTENFYFFNDYYHNDPEFHDSGVVEPGLIPIEVSRAFADSWLYVKALDPIAYALLNYGDDADGTCYLKIQHTTNSLSGSSVEYANVVRSDLCAWKDATSEIHTGALPLGHPVYGSGSIDLSRTGKLSFRLTNPNSDVMVGIARWEIGISTAIDGALDDSAPMFDLAMCDESICGGRKEIAKDEAQLESVLILEAHLLNYDLQQHYINSGVSFEELP